MQSPAPKAAKTTHHITAALLIVALNVYATPALADELTAADIKTTVSGKTVHVSHSAGSVPIYFRANGTMRGTVTGLATLSGPKTDSGRWWVSGSKLCQKWSKWLKGKTHCVSLRRKGKTYVWKSGNGQSGVARVASSQ